MMRERDHKRAQAEYREKNREAIRLANRMNVSVSAAMEAIALLREAPDAGETFADPEDSARPSAGETIEQRIAKDYWRRHLVTGYVEALATGDYRRHNEAEGALRKIIAGPVNRNIGKPTSAETATNVKRLSAQGYSQRQIAATLGIGKSTAQDIMSERYTGKAKMSLTIVVKRDDRVIAEFDASTKGMTLHSLNEPESKVDVRKALRRAYEAARQQWDEPSSGEID